MNTFEKLERLTELAKKDETLRKALLKTRENKEPILSFCALAREAGDARLDAAFDELLAAYEPIG